jgi:poly-gamma-glutamate capsule biosynthesis protein CapA/YwtB (metallophosphatase superfamily)
LKLKSVLLLAASIAAASISFIHLDQAPALKPDALSKSEDILTTATLAFVGDLMCHSVQYNYAFVEKDSFNFDPVYRYIKTYFEKPDFLVGNLETVTAGKEAVYSGYPFFNTPDDYVESLSKAGFDFLTTTNNHSLDRGEKGVKRTIEVITKNNLGYTGTFNSPGDRDSIRILNIFGIKLAFLAYTYGTNGIPIPKGKDYLINLIDTAKIESNIKTARSIGAEIVAVSFHFGEEYQRTPNTFQQDVVKAAINSGADLIIGSHPHVIQPTKFYKGKGTLDSAFVAYSLGNFISNQRWRYSDAGVMILVTLRKNITSGEVKLAGVSYLPTWVYKGTTERGREYILLPAAYHDKKELQFLNSSDRQAMLQAFNDTKEIITSKNSRISLFPAE